MRADNIIEIIKSYDKSPYECILIDGEWGIGKSYAIGEAFENNDNVSFISMFGIKDAQEIYHEAFFELAMKNKSGVAKVIKNLVNVGAELSDKIKGIRSVVKSLVNERELFLGVSKEFDKMHYVVLDDLERMKSNIKIEEVFGIIDEIKKCNYVKVILIANVKELSVDVKAKFEKYSEKVIDKTYVITECPKTVHWAKLRIHDGFIREFLKRHKVSNLRTLQKAQNFYDDVRTKLKTEYVEEFYDNIRLACYAIVVESVDKIYERKQENIKVGETDISNTLEVRIISNYLIGTKLSNSLVEILMKYYENQMELIDDIIDVEHQLFIEAGEKSNFYKSDDEIKRILPVIAKKVNQETQLLRIIKFADEYFIWSKHVNVDNTALQKEYKEKLHEILWHTVMDGNVGVLVSNESLLFHMNSPINKVIFKEVIEDLKNEVFDAYVEYLSKSTMDERAYEYSERLKGFVDNTFLRNYVTGRVNDLYNKNSFPIHDMSEQKYRISYNIMYVLYNENKEKFLKYCDDIKKECDNMANHRINVLLERIINNY